MYKHSRCHPQTRTDSIIPCCSMATFGAQLQFNNWQESCEGNLHRVSFNGNKHKPSLKCFLLGWNPSSKLVGSDGLYMVASLAVKPITILCLCKKSKPNIMGIIRKGVNNNKTVNYPCK